MKGSKKNNVGESCNANIMKKKFMHMCVKIRRDRIKLGIQIVLKMCIIIDDVKDIKEKNTLANNFVIFIDTMKEYLIQDVLKLNLNYMVECSYERPPENEIPNAAVTMLSKYRRREYSKISAQI